MRNILVSILLCAAFACTKSTPTKAPEGATAEKPMANEAADEAAAERAAEEAAAKKAEEEAANQAAAEKKAAEEAAAKQAEAERVAKMRAEEEEQAKAEKARWTADLRAKTKKLVAGKYKDAKAALTAILKSPHRVPGNADRDRYRHPLETLMLFGIQPNMTVIEAGAGEGWYSEILAAFLGKKGKLIIASYDPNGPETAYRTVAGLRIQWMLEKSTELFATTQTVIVDPPNRIELGPPASADMVIAIREMHGWYRNGYFDQYAKAVHSVLKPGGVFGVVQHRAKPGAKVEESAQGGYLPEEWVIAQVEKAGFKLAERSEVNANPNDTKDYEGGVWTLPPNYRLGDKDRDKYKAIGESDRMTLKFVKAE